MSKEDAISEKEHRRQIELFARERPDYEIYAAALKRVLEKACSGSVPEAWVQTRAKTVASFAEKCVRKYAKYKDAVHQLTDLCGARVIVHTLDHVQAVRAFVRCNFEVLEEDEKGLSLGRDKFGYRDLHFLIRLNSDRAAAVGFTVKEIRRIGQRIAELQIRTLVQHAWADILHDRMYKSKLIYPPEFQRKGALLAAIMEDGDRQFSSLTSDVDGMLTNFNVYVPCEEIKKETAVQRLIHANAAKDKKAVSALALARLLAVQGNYGEVCAILEPHAKENDRPLFAEILLELGFAQCKANLKEIASSGYRTGQRRLESVVQSCRAEVLDRVPDLHKQKSLLARALTRLAWSYGPVRGAEKQARMYYLDALREEPGNPYYLSEALALEIANTKARDMVGAMESVILSAVATCDQHAENGTELPYACFTAGRLLLLLGEPRRAVANYALGLWHLNAKKICVPPDVLEQELDWLRRIDLAKAPVEGVQWVRDLIALSGKTAEPFKSDAALSTAIKAPVMIVAGSAGVGLSSDAAARLTECLKAALADTHGSIISGGTTVGVPHCIASAAGWAEENWRTVPELLGYLPCKLPVGVSVDSRYRIEICGEDDFSPEQILHYWADLLAAGVQPHSVTLFGYGGGEVSAVEYAVALLFGANVYLVRGSGRAADAFLKREGAMDNLKGLPNDDASIRALFQTVLGTSGSVDQRALTKMAQAFHANYVSENQGKLPCNIRPWSLLEKTYVRANIEQARYAARILRACGFGVVDKSARGKALSSAELASEIESMSELEHGRWNVDRLSDGWRFGPRDNDKRTHNCLVTWRELPDDVREWDRRAIRKYPEILASVGLKIVVRRQKKQRGAQRQSE